LDFFIFHKFLSFPQDRASARQQLWMVEDTLAGLSGPQKQPLPTEPESPSPVLQGEESSEREVRPTLLLSPQFPVPTHAPFPSLLLNQLQASTFSSGSLFFLIYYTNIPQCLMGMVLEPSLLWIPKPVQMGWVDCPAILGQWCPL
jgi:hypothetical protein